MPLVPGRPIRFIWMPEWYGTQAYLDAHPEMAGPALGGTWLANVNMDMVGENLELLHSRMILTRTPSSLPSALNDVVANMAEMMGRMDIRTPRGSHSAPNWQVTAYSGGSDHIQFIDRKIPSTMLGHSPDYTHHTSDDTPDMVDPVELERSEIVATGALVYLSSLTETEALDLVDRVGAAGLARVAGTAGDERRLGSEYGETPAEAMELSATGEAANRADLEALTSGSGMEGGLTTEEYLQIFDPDFNSVVDIAAIAMSIEGQALDLYMRAAAASSDEEGRRMLKQMADEEKAHLALLGDLVDNINR